MHLKMSDLALSAALAQALPKTGAAKSEATNCPLGAA
jgi:hypothetical protein